MNQAIPMHVTLGCASNRVAASIAAIEGRDKADTDAKKMAMFRAWLDEPGYMPQDFTPA